jgi:hypothetical protein
MEYPVLEAVGSGRRIDVASLDRPAVFICYTEATQNDADAVEAAVRARYSAAQVLVAHVIDLHSVPRLFRGAAEGILRSEHARAVSELPPGENAYDYVIVLPDWDGAFVNALALEDVSKRLGVGVFGAGGQLAGTAQGDGVPAATMQLLTLALG